jgi:A/G-specific adenine glycosylase
MTDLPKVRAALAAWYERWKRDLPWRRTRDPYRIWVSEIMLQQTRVATVIPYYDRFVERYPNLDALAAAEEQELLGMWAGLGYYSRARNLQAAAKEMVRQGGFPREYAAIRALPGVGEYTAAAVGSIAFGLPHAVVDGNVLRVMARFLAESGDISSSVTKNRLREAAEEFLDREEPSRHNQAVMELGATVCTPKDPGCGRCPLEPWCEGQAQGLARELPVKKGKTAIRRVERSLLVVMRNGNLLLWQRPPDAAILSGFWELPEPHQLPQANFGAALHRFKHSITNHIYHFEVFEATVGRWKPAAGDGWQWVPLAGLAGIPLSTTARKALAGMAQGHLFG